MNGVFAFLDLLGFSNYVESDLPGAARLLESQRHILQIKLGDEAHYTSQQTEISDFGRDRLVTSFDHFLPFSDCIFIASNTPDLFLRQLAHFLIETFLFTGHAYAHPDDPKNPTRVDRRVISRSGVKTEPQNWFPVLWRGGLDFGRLELWETAGIQQGKPLVLPLLAGLPVANAVRMEKTAKGPRLFCRPDFQTNFTDPSLLKLLVPVPEKPDLKEFLWPALLFHDRTHPLQELGRMQELFVPAVNLWRQAAIPEVQAHYLAFLHLIGRSARAWADQNNISKEGRVYLQQLAVAFAWNDVPEEVLA